MRIIGIDPGSIKTGVAIIEAQPQRIETLFYGVIHTKNPDNSLAARIKIIFDDLQQLTQEYAPQCAAIEQVFVGKSVSSALKLGHARGAAMCALAGLSISEYAPRLIKQAVTGSGSASKEQVQHMVMQILALNTARIPADAADALAVAICHAHLQSQGAQALLCRRR